MSDPERGAPEEGGEGFGPRSWHRTRLLDRAEDILQGASATPDEILDLANGLANKEQRFGYARRLLERARGMPLEDRSLGRRLRQRLVLCTYKDPELPADARLELALEILREGPDLATTEDQETLGLAGAIFKRKWEVDGRKENLERSLAYYLAGYEVGPGTDQGYTGINAAYVLDLMADVERTEAVRSDRAAASGIREARAREIREDLVAALPGLLDRPETGWLADRWWFYATLAEACFGLGRYDQAREWLDEGRARVPELPEWELQSTVTQLAGLARIQARGASSGEFVRSDAFRVLSGFLGDDAAAALTGYVGKVGLALSGGGFRASLFHIGVLARLAELELLRHVEVLSCVSGGSILGAHYYLELRRLLEEKEDRDITRDDYVELVRRVQEGFLAGVQKNIRTRIAGEFLTNLRMIFLPDYSRTMRAGELFERFIYDRVRDGTRNEGSWWAPWRRYRRWLTDLYIFPRGDRSDFRPKVHNWRRRSKVPDLILNATALNSGHNWQFTASWMGEPPGGVDPEVGGNPRLRRMYYWEAPERYRRVRLGYAVAASACVPGLFEPISLPGLYPGMTVCLVDGGVWDNQGIGGLLDQDCNVLLVSDASGQMEAEEEPSRGGLGVSLRSMSILGSRIRSAQYAELRERRRARLLRGLIAVHLKQDLPVIPVDWLGRQGSEEGAGKARSTARRDDLTGYGIHMDMQRRIAAIRTDLDSFSEAEAFSLMASGYRMTDRAFREDPSLRALPLSDAGPERWTFLKVEGALREAPGSGRLGKILDVAGRRTLKVWRLSPSLRVLAAVLVPVVLTALAWGLYTFRDRPLVTVGTVGAVALGLVGSALFGKWVIRIVRVRDTLTKVGLGVVLAILGPGLVRTHLWVFDRIYLRLGKVERVLRSGDDGRGGASGPLIRLVGREQADRLPRAGSMDRIVVFSGHMVDLPNRPEPRFPPDLESTAGEAIRSALASFRDSGRGRILAMSAAARGGDILFIEACRSLRVPHRLCLPFEPERFLRTSVEGAGPGWVRRYRRILEDAGPSPLLMPSDYPEPEPEANPFVRFNLWLLELAQHLGDELHMIALWDGRGGDGPGGTEDVVERVRERGGRVVHVNPRTLLAELGKGSGDPRT